MPRQRKYMSSEQFAKAGVLQAASGMTYTDMQEDLRDVAEDDLRLYVDEMPEEVTFVMNGKVRKEFNPLKAPKAVGARLKMGSPFLLTSKAPASLLPVVREAYAKVRSIMPVDMRSGRDNVLASKHVRYITNVKNGNAGPGYTLKTSLNQSDVDDPLAVVGVVGIVDYAAILEQKGFSTTTPFRKTGGFIRRKYSDRAEVVFSFLQPIQIGLSAQGKKVTARYALPAILISHLGNNIAPQYRSRAHRTYDRKRHQGLIPRQGRRKPGR